MPSATLDRWRSASATRGLAAAAIGAASAASFAAIGHAFLETGHPAEDAFIFYRYAENLAAGHGIVFNVGGPPAEGATDFLWLLVLAGPVRLGADVALVALGSNALAAGLIAALMARVVLRARLHVALRAGLAVLPMAIVLSSVAFASYVGFSAMFFAAFAVLLLAVAAEGRGRALLALPALGVGLGLIRPEGAAMGAAFAALGLPLATRAGRARGYLAACAGAALVGLGYFAWRYAYFGLLLPLPLIVKGRGPILQTSWELLDRLGTALPGLVYNAWWFRAPDGPLAAVVALTVLAIFVGGGARLRRLLLALLPSVVLFALLLVPMQSQNISWRFQAPIFASLVYAMLQVGVWALEGAATVPRRLVVAGVLLAGFLPWVQTGAAVVAAIGEKRGEYVDTFAPALGAHLGPDDVVALTEAGRLAYWTSARVEDVVGLNSPEYARRPVTTLDLERLDPDVVMFHHSGVLNVEASAVARRRGWMLLPSESLAGAVHPAFQRLFREGVHGYDRSVGLPTRVAAIQMARFLAGNPGYDVVLVDFGRNGSFYHVYGFRKGPLSNRLRHVLAGLLPSGPYRSYLDLKRWPLRVPSD